MSELKSHPVSSADIAVTEHAVNGVPVGTRAWASSRAAGEMGTGSGRAQEVPHDRTARLRLLAGSAIGVGFLFVGSLACSGTRFAVRRTFRCGRVGSDDLRDRRGLAGAGAVDIRGDCARRGWPPGVAGHPDLDDARLVCGGRPGYPPCGPRGPGHHPWHPHSDDGGHSRRISRCCVRSVTLACCSLAADTRRCRCRRRSVPRPCSGRRSWCGPTTRLTYGNSPSTV